MIDAAGDAAVFAGNLVDRDDAIAGGVLLVGAEVALQHEGVRVGVDVEAETVHIALS